MATGNWRLATGDWQLKAGVGLLPSTFCLSLKATIHIRIHNI